MALVDDWMKNTQNKPDSVFGAGWQYTVKYSRRKTMGIYVSAEHGVEVRVPHSVARGVVDTFVESKRAWIEKQLRTLASQPIKFEPEYQWGGSVYFLGDKHVVHCQDLPATDVVIPGQITDSQESIERKIIQWFRAQALELFSERHEHWRTQLSGWDLPPSRVGVRAMKRRWGSCRKSGDITLNVFLARYPLSCIDVVLVHELCHLLEFNHSHRFYKLMSAAMADWKQHDDMLNRLSQLY